MRRAGHVLAVCSTVLLGQVISAVETEDYGSDLTAEELLDAWLAPDEPVAPESPTAPPPPIPTFEADLKLRAGGGYKKNVLYSAVHPLDSGYSQVDLDLFLYRELPRDQNFYLYLYADQRHYFELTRADDEQSVTAEASWGLPDPPVDVLRLSASYFYVDQFYDASLSDIEIDDYRLRQHDLGGHATVEQYIGHAWGLRLRGGYREVIVPDYDDDYSAWDVSGGLDYAWSARAGVTALASHSFEDYKDRLMRAADGEALPGGTVDIEYDRLELLLRSRLDSRERWQLRLRGTLTLREDNAGGYYDYLGYRGRGLLRYRAEPWTAEIGGGYTYLDYDVRPADLYVPEGSTLYRSWWSTWVRGEYVFRRPWKCFVEARFEDYASNDPLSVYDHRWILGGIGLEF